MNLQKLISMREGQRRLISVQLEKFTHELSESEKAALLHIVEEKAETIKSLNDKIINHPDVEDLTTELVDSGEYSIELDLKLSKLRNDLQQRSRPVVNSPSETDVNASATVATGIQTSQQHTPLIQPQVSAQSFTNCNTKASLHKLPKLSLPTFDGDVTLWQTFWDSFESSVHSNSSLSDVEKFSYLRSLMRDSAAATIAGFPLTNANYSNAIDLLRQRFGQSHKIVDMYMQKLLDLPAPNNCVSSLRNFHDMMESYVRGLQSLGQCQDSYGDLLVPILMKKLPSSMRGNLARDHGDAKWTIQELRDAIAREITILEASQDSGAFYDHVPTASFLTGTLKRKSQCHTGAQGNRPNMSNPQCVFCSGQHYSVKCDKIESVQERLRIVKSKQLCFNCLRRHIVADCRSKHRCHKCNRKHHSSICSETHKAPQLNPLAEPFKSSTGRHGYADTTIMHSASHKKSSVLLKTAVAKVKSTSLTCEANILFDEGAQRSFITETLADRLKVQQAGREFISLAMFGGNAQQKRAIPTGRIYLQASNGDSIPLDVLIVPKIAIPLPNIPACVSRLKYLRGLKLAHPIPDDDYGQFEIALLIGADHYWEIVQNKVVRGNGPTAVKSKIGYLLSGPLPVSDTQSSTSCILNVMTTPPSVMDLERFWNLESMGISAEETKSSTSDVMDTYIEQNISFQDGRYIAKLPWKEDHPPLPTNYAVCKRRTEKTIRQLSKEPELLQKYGYIIEEQLRRGFIEKVYTTIETSHAVHYIPHHGVLKESSTTPVRIVYDCSCRQSRNEPSLNDCLLSTPPELNDLTGILLRFRMYKYAAATDIEKAFLHVGLDERDRDVTRFLWLNEPNDPGSALTPYRFKTVLFGATCSPFILSATIRKHLQINSNNQSSERLRRDLYVDNVLSSFPHETDILQYFEQSRILMSSAGFNLRSWSSNCDNLRQLATGDNVLESDLCPKVLGMRWDSQHDTLQFQQRQIPVSENTTKREILQQTSRLYDPLGLLSPVTIRAKMLLQELWQLKYDWDTLLPVDVQNKWHSLVADLNLAASTQLPRCYFDDSTRPDDVTTDDTCLHIFCDASMKAYGSSVYISKGDESTLIMAKTRVAPLKTLTLPRLELMAAVVGARLCRHVKQNTGVSRVQLWSDSQVVLHWLQTSKPLQRFVRNRVSEIHKLTSNLKWKYCPSEDNPADLLTRGLTAEEFKHNKLWLHGPSWIVTPDAWPVWIPTAPSVVLTTLDDNSTVRLPSSSDSVVDVTRFSSLSKLHRVTAYVLRFIHKCRVGRSAARFEPLTAQEIQVAEGMSRPSTP